MHNKYATFVLPVLAGLAIVGAGFSTWVFGNKTSATKSATGSAIITGDETTGPAVSLKLGYISGGIFTEVSSPSFALTLDQGGASNATNKEAGITFAWLGDSTVVDALNTNGLSFQWSISSEDATAYSNYSVTVNYTLGLQNVDDGKILSYVGLADSVNMPTESQAVVTDELVSRLASGNGTSYINQSVAFKPTSWVYTNKPGNLVDYQSMLSDLGLAYDAESESYTSTQQIEFVFTVETTFTLNQ